MEPGNSQLMETALTDADCKHDYTDCPACRRTFLCMANRAEHCACNEVQLTRDEMQSLTWLWGESCLCPHCLLRERDNLRNPVSNSSAA